MQSWEWWCFAASRRVHILQWISTKRHLENVFDALIKGVTHGAWHITSDKGQQGTIRVVKLENVSVTRYVREQLVK